MLSRIPGQWEGVHSSGFESATHKFPSSWRAHEVVIVESEDFERLVTICILAALADDRTGRRFVAFDGDDCRRIDLNEIGQLSHKGGHRWLNCRAPLITHSQVWDFPDTVRHKGRHDLVPIG